MNEIVKHKILHNLQRLRTSLKWVIFAILSGILIGHVCTLFSYYMTIVTETRAAHPWLIWLLPFGGLFIVGSYHLLHDEKDTGTNLVLSSVQSGNPLPLRMAPLIFLTTLATHLFGGSAGREGAALQLGGSLGSWIGKLFRFSEMDNKVMIMCGMSAAFSALFGTPMAAAIFSMEVVSVGIMHYAALVPCVIAALIAKGIAISFGVEAESFPLESIPDFSLGTAAGICALASACALLSVLFCILLHQSEHLYQKHLKNPYLRVFAGGCIVALLTWLVGDQRYNGSGISIVAHCMEEGAAAPELFALKMLFTAATIGAGFKGGEIVPSFSIGAAFGCLLGNLAGFAPDLCTAVGMAAVFCGVTNCPIASLLISFELFGYEGMPYFLLAVAFSYMLSGYYGLYHGQKIMYSKYKINYIDKKAE